MKFKVTANVGLEAQGNTVYRFTNFEIIIDGDKTFTFQQLFESLEKEARAKYQDFKNFANIRVAKVEE